MQIEAKQFNTLDFSKKVLMNKPHKVLLPRHVLYHWATTTAKTLVLLILRIFGGHFRRGWQLTQQDKSDIKIKLSNPGISSELNFVPGKPKVSICSSVSGNVSTPTVLEASFQKNWKVQNGSLGKIKESCQERMNPRSLFYAEGCS